VLRNGGGKIRLSAVKKNNQRQTIALQHTVPYLHARLRRSTAPAYRAFGTRRMRDDVGDQIDTVRGASRRRWRAIVLARTPRATYVALYLPAARC